MTTVHVFAESLDLSKRHADAPWWEPLYREAFPTLETMTCVREDGWAQRGGIDRVLVLADGSTLKVDEKVREEDWPDILLERWSDRDRQKPGWVQKDLTCDFIAYAFIPSQRCYLLPFRTLRRAWRLKGRAWVYYAENRMRGFKVVDAQNQGYVTQSVAVPTGELLDAVRDAMVVSWAGRSVAA